MLTLTRKAGESIKIGDDISIVIKEIKGRQVRIGIIAPRDVYVCREELFVKIQEENVAAQRALQSMARGGDTPEDDPLNTISSLLQARMLIAAQLTPPPPSTTEAERSTLTQDQGPTHSSDSSEARPTIKRGEGMDED